MPGLTALLLTGALLSAATVGPTDQDLLLALAVARNGGIAEAKHSLVEIAARTSDQEVGAAALMNLALIYGQEGDTESRNRYCGELLQRFPHSYVAPDAARLLGRPAWLSDTISARPAPAATPAAAPPVSYGTLEPQPLATAPVMSPRAQECFRNGESAVADKRYVAAILAFREAAALMPDNAEVLFNLATAYYLNNDNANAEQAYLSVTRLKPRDVEALIYLGVTRYQQGRRAEAIADWKRALEIDPGNERAQFLLNSSTRNRR